MFASENSKTLVFNVCSMFTLLLIVILDLKGSSVSSNVAVKTD